MLIKVELLLLCLLNFVNSSIIPSPIITAEGIIRRTDSSHTQKKLSHGQSIFSPPEHLQSGYERCLNSNYRTGSHTGAVLFDELFCKRKYNRNVMPVNTTSSAVVIKLLLKLTQLISVDEKNQIMTTNVWLHHEWYDFGLVWNPKQYDGITAIHVNAKDLWLPDTVLYNNADGDYQITIDTKIEVRYDGLVVWEPPAIYKSFCAIAVEYFPFDTQTCELKFGPWTYDVSKVNYVMVSPEGKLSDYHKTAVDVGGFYASTEWDVLEISGLRTVFQYPCCEEKYVDITYSLRIRRRTLFYTVNLIIPCLMISLLTIVVFYLPSRSSEKITFSISTLLALTWFILLLSRIIPPTSIALPLVVKYLLFTMALVTLSIVTSVIVLHNYFRHPYTAAMPHWVRFVFLRMLPKFVCLPTESVHFHQTTNESTAGENHSVCASPSPCPVDKVSSTGLLDEGGQTRSDAIKLSLEHLTSDDTMGSSSDSLPCVSEPKSCVTSVTGNESPYCRVRKVRLEKRKHFLRRKRLGRALPAPNSHHELTKKSMVAAVNKTLLALHDYFHLPIVQKAVFSINCLSQRYYEETFDVAKQIEWEMFARVFDRFLLILFSFVTTFGSLAILLWAPTFYDTTPILLIKSANRIISSAFLFSAGNFTEIVITE